MMDFSRASASEVMAEAKRRAERRAKGLPIHETPTEIQEREVEDDTRQEKAIQHDVVKLYRAHRCVVYNLSQSRATKQTPGIADLYVVCPSAGVAWWMECKTANGRSSPAQLEFEEMCRISGVSYVIGGLRAAVNKLRSIGVMVDDPF